MRLDRLKEEMAVTDDAEWKVLETSIGKVMDAQRDVLSGMMGWRRFWSRRTRAVETPITLRLTRMDKMADEPRRRRRILRHPQPGSGSPQDRPAGLVAMPPPMPSMRS